jgi:hypothetical protein
MLPASTADIVEFAADQPPKILCVIDAEEEFDWGRPFSRNNDSVKTIRSQVLAQNVFGRFKLVPTYAVDYPVAAKEDGYRPLRELAQSGLCEIGAQLHPWVTPPYEEEVNNENSFAYNLPDVLQRKKMAALGEVIEQNFGVKPKILRTGRYGAGQATIGLLQEFGYEMDCSVVPGPPITQFSPDYSGAPSKPYWLGRHTELLEIPVTAGLVGGMRHSQSLANALFSSSLARSLKLPGVFSRMGLLNRVRLSPEGHPLAEAKALTRALLRDGQRVFSISYHSPSLEPGNTPYTGTAKDVERFLGWLEGYLEFFVTEIGGEPSTPSQIYSLAKAAQISRQQLGSTMAGGSIGSPKVGI